ncbi:avidin/streptavidin family protein [Mycolicibacterium thermoresistibile]
MVLQHISGLRKSAQTSGRPVDFNGTWLNELGSELHLEVDGQGRVTGTFQTAVGAPQPTQKFEVTGFVAGDVLAFCVNFGAYASLSSWVGQHTVEDGNEVIKAMWLLGRDIKDADEPTDLWSAVLTGASNFRR